MPVAVPATGDLTGTPASIIAIAPPHTDAIDDEPLDSRVWDTTTVQRRRNRAATEQFRLS
jgi:hypothetical protein